MFTFNFNNTSTISCSASESANTINCEFDVNTAAVMLPIAVMTAQTAPISNVEMYFTPQFFIPANTIQSGSVFQIDLISESWLQGPSNNPNGFAINVKFGSTGTISDPAIWFTNGEPDTSGLGKFQLLMVIQNTGNNSNVITTPTGFYTPGEPGYFITNTFSTIDTTVDNYLGATVVFAPAGSSPTPIGNSTFDIAIIRKIN